MSLRRPSRLHHLFVYLLFVLPLVLASGCAWSEPVASPEAVHHQVATTVRPATSVRSVDSPSPPSEEKRRSVTPVSSLAFVSSTPTEADPEQDEILRADAPVSSGEFDVAETTGQVAGIGWLRTYTVEVETTLADDVGEVAAFVDETLGSSKSWIGDETVSFQRLPNDASFRILIATAETTDRLCAPLRTNGYFSCRAGDDVVINATRWSDAVPDWASSLNDYRTYVINHEVGHLLGRGHVGCPAAGSPAPVMMQQTKSIGSCAPNPWPYP